MLCERCNENPATVHIVKVVNGVKEETNICEQCAKEQENFGIGSDFNMVSPFSFQSLLSGLVDYINQSSQGEPFKEISCKNCGITYSEFKRKGLLGCSKCYDTFNETIMPIIKRVQGDTEHIGKLPLKSGKELMEKKKVINLKEELQKAILNEEYEKAAMIRDELKALQKSE
ncbi:UvrB/UvrC motif-containing protein [Clostridium sp. MSJ-4]|uniref:UvrB/UvrC motif-containing protein n=1 Tax=Clostridium simiarum TaxID=2841506 RepID=A0ABS6EZP0_9CLOT|nr:UvrB/UvrC motif-containing protein [Clostridium amazonitimonense]MBU5591707.1 UvrB/UvrC motif-containing protein [Clostridium simiarum]